MVVLMQIIWKIVYFIFLEVNTNLHFCIKCHQLTKLLECIRISHTFHEFAHKNP